VAVAVVTFAIPAPTVAVEEAQGCERPCLLVNHTSRLLYDYDAMLIGWRRDRRCVVADNSGWERVAFLLHQTPQKLI
jgi:hypothetical protein